MKFFLMLMVMSHFSVQGTEGQEYKTPCFPSHLTPVCVPTEGLERFGKGLCSLLVECREDNVVLQRSLAAVLDPTQCESLISLCDSCQEKLGALQQKMNDATFDGHPFFGTVWQFGEPHLLSGQKNVVDTGWSKFGQPPSIEDEKKLLEELKSGYNAIVDQMKELLANSGGASTFFALDEAQSIGLMVTPGCGISAIWPKPNLPPSFDLRRAKECCEQSLAAHFDIMNLIDVLALAGGVYRELLVD